MKFKTLIVFLFISISVSATNDVNLTIDSMGFEYCLITGNNTHYTCNATSYITLDGTDDPFLVLSHSPIFNPDVKRVELRTLSFAEYMVNHWFFIFEVGFMVIILFVGMVTVITGGIFRN